MNASSVLSCKTVEVDGKAVAYCEAGKGEPLVLLHGGGPGASGVSNYSRNVDMLSQRYRVIIPDLPGYGGTFKDPITTPRFTAYAECMLGLFDVIGLDKAHVVGNSLGGGTALLMAMIAPKRIDKLVLMGPAGLISAYTKIPTEGIRMILHYYGGDGPTPEKLRAFIELMIYDSSNLTEELLRERFEASTTPEIMKNPPLGGGGAPPILEEIWRDKRLTTLPHDTLVFWGRDDQVNPLYTAEILMDQLPKARMVSFTQCGHWVQWERADAFNTILSNFLAEESADQ